jgi:hypothetical protein
MWSLKINDVILDYYSEFYTQRERNYYKINVFNSIVGGARGLKMILGEKPNLTDPYELYTEHLVETSRKICDDFYTRTCDPLVRTSTTIPNKEIKIEVASRLVATVYIESTTRCSAVDVEIEEPTINIPYPYNTTLEKTKEEVLATNTRNKYRVVSPHLYLIDMLHKINNPFKQKEKNDNRELIKKLFEKTDEQYFRGNYSTIEEEIESAMTLFNNDFDSLVHNRVFIGFRNNTLILASDKESDEEYKFLSSKYTFDNKSHNVLLPNELFLVKIVGKYKPKNRFRICIYNIGYHEVIPVNNIVLEKIGNIQVSYPSLRSRMFMIEDNTLISLQSIGKASFIVYYMTKEDLDEALIEEYPTASNREEMNDIFKKRFYGIYRNMTTVRKLYIKELEKIGPYYPYVIMHKKRQPCTGEDKIDQPYDKKILELD